MIKQIIVQVLIMLAFASLVVRQVVDRCFTTISADITRQCLNNGAMTINGVVFECNPRMIEK